MPRPSSSAVSELDAKRIGDILHAAQVIRGYCREVSESKFILDPILQDAVIRRITVIGEAASKLTPAARRKYAEVPWDAIISMRHMLVHDYDRSDVSIIWRTVENYLPELEKALRKQ